MELDLEQARRRAKERLRAARRGEVALREDREPRLAGRAAFGGERARASRRGRRSSAHVRGDRRGPRGACARGSSRRRSPAAPTAPSALLDADPALARAGLDVALVLGDADAVAAALRADPGLVHARAAASGPQAAVVRVPLGVPRARPRRARPACGAWSSCCSTRAPTRTRRSTTSTARCRCSTAPRASRTTRRRRGCCSTAARTPTTASPSTTPSRRSDTACLELLLERGATVRGTNALGNAIRAAGRCCGCCSSAATCAPADPELRDSLLWVARGRRRAAADRARRRPRGARPRRPDAVLDAARRRRRVADGGCSPRPARDTDADPVAEWLGAARARRARRRGRRGARAAPRRRRAAADARQRGSRRRRRAAARGRRPAARPRRRRGHRAALRGHVGPGEHGRAAARPRRRAEPDGRPARAPEQRARLDRLGLAGARPRAASGSRATSRRRGALLAAGASVGEGVAEVAADDVAVLLEEVEPRDERLYEVGPVLVRVRCRGGRCEIDDRGWAVAAAGRPPGWLDASPSARSRSCGWNVARTGAGVRRRGRRPRHRRPRAPHRGRRARGPRRAPRARE